MNGKIFVVMGIIILFFGTNVASVVGQIENEELLKNLNRNAPVSIIAGKPTKTGVWILHITHDGTYNGNKYVGTWTFTIKTNSGMTAAEKADAMRKQINARKCPITAGGAEANVDVTPSNGKITKWSSKATDGQFVHGTALSAAYSFQGLPSVGSVSVEVNGVNASTSTMGKPLEIIHSELCSLLLAGGADVILDPSGLALYLFNIDNYSGLDSDDDELSALGVFTIEEMVESFDVYVDMHDDIISPPDTIVTATFTITNFKFHPDIYAITVKDNLGWNLNPTYHEMLIETGHNATIDIMITIPPGARATTNIINLTAASLTEPWTNSSGYCYVIANNPPDDPDIDGSTNGKAGTAYTYTFTSTDPDGDDVYYCINWGDDSGEVCIGPYPSGEGAIATHTWTDQGTYIIEAQAKDIYDAESDWVSLEVSMPRSITFNIFFQRIFERLPNGFPNLRYIFGLVGS